MIKNIFVRRRQNEIIIMAVNGFTWKEQRGYLIRESVATILIGLLFGVLGGYLMTDFLVKSVEHETVMFIREFDTRAWIFAVVLELIFALIINLISYRNLRKLKLTDITK
jgi:putative ABC transport system permease protein